MCLDVDAIVTQPITKRLPSRPMALRKRTEFRHLGVGLHRCASASPCLGDLDVDDRVETVVG